MESDQNLALETVLTTMYKEDMEAYIMRHPQRIVGLIELALSTKQRFAPRAAWLLSNTMSYNDPRVSDFVPSFIEVLPKLKDGHQRDLLKVISNMKLKEEYEGVVFDICVDLWCKIGKIPSVRYTAMKYLVKVAEMHPELNQEIILLVQDHYLESLSPGIKRAIRKMVNALS